MALAAPPGANAQALDQKVPPNQSIYIQNLPEKFQKEDLRRELYMLLSTYGPVIDITALKTKRMRGQAHVLFKDVTSATQAIRGCQGFDFYGREMVRLGTSHDSTFKPLTDCDLRESAIPSNARTHSRNSQATSASPQLATRPSKSHSLRAAFQHHLAPL